MAMNPAERAIAQEYFKEYWQGPIACPICKTSGWIMQDTFAMLSYATAGPGAGPQVGPQTFPVLIVSCKKCHYLHHFMWLPIKKLIEDKRRAAAQALATGIKSLAAEQAKKGGTRGK